MIKKLKFTISFLLHIACKNFKELVKCDNFWKPWMEDLSAIDLKALREAEAIAESEDTTVEAEYHKLIDKKNRMR